MLTTPGEVAFKIVEPEGYTVWQSNTAVVNDTFVTHSSNLPEGLHVTLFNTDSGTTVPLSRSLGSTMQSGSEYKQSLFKADLNPGNYKLVAHSDPASPITLEVTKETKLRSFFILFAVISVGSILLSIGILIILVKIIRYFFKSATVTM